MMLRLHLHPFASFCQKVMVGLYETEMPFEANVVDLGDPAQRATLAALWPFGKLPVLELGDAFFPYRDHDSPKQIEAIR